MGDVFIGTSGYSYKGWDKTFYGDETPKSRQLEFYAERFPTVEINATFYRLPSEGMVAGWRDRVDESFRYAVKGSRFITHMKKLANLDGAMDKFFDRIDPMKSKTAIILWQLPPMLKLDLPRLDDFLAQAPAEYEHAVEFRHPSWNTDETFALLARHHAAHVNLSSKGMPMNLTVTHNIVYIRFHGLEGGAAHDYTIPELEPWAKFIREQAEAGRTVYAYFNNDINTRAPENGFQLMDMVGEHTVRPHQSRAAPITSGPLARPAIRVAPIPRSKASRR
ncbi:MAG TPA: DUF72 domain-containing protein [Methylomirabilota bacterium]|nr:DUF72 domain-containing protein [Methylomirabilota bacterium]